MREHKSSHAGRDALGGDHENEGPQLSIVRDLWVQVTSDASKRVEGMRMKAIMEKRKRCEK